jgi:hypothetical protein
LNVLHLLNPGTSAAHSVQARDDSAADLIHDCRPWRPDAS